MTLFDESIKPEVVRLINENSSMVNAHLAEWVKKEKEKGSALFPDLKIDKKKKTIYRNCDLKKEGVLDQVFKNEIAVGIDVHYYATRVEWWSNTKEGVKRGFYGWRDTINKFMSDAKEAGKLKMLETEPKEESEFQKRYREKVEGMR